MTGTGRSGHPRGTVLLAAGVLPQGFSPSGVERFLEVVAGEGTFRPRSEVEGDDSLKQVIPYAVVTFREKVFLFRRTARGGEARLHRKLSIGVGGHINREGEAAQVLPQMRVEFGLMRELSEELDFTRPPSHRAAGLVNDDESPVGRVHAGIVFRVEAADEGVRVRETEILEGGFVAAASLAPLLPEMETWSRFVAASLFP